MDNLGKGFREAAAHPAEHSANRKIAPLWRRAVSFIIDLFILNILVFGPFAGTLTSFVEEADIMAASIPSNVYFAVISIGILSLLYFSVMQYYFQQTLGMMIMKLYVQPQPGFLRSVARNIYILPFFPFNLLWVIEPLYLVFKGRRLMEQLTKTDTVEMS